MTYSDSTNHTAASGGAAYASAHSPSEHEFWAEVPRQYVGDSEPFMMIGISAAGGGVIGESYTGTWAYCVTVDGEPVISGDDLRSGAMGDTHAGMAQSLASFLACAGESLHYRDDGSEYSDEYNDAQRAFLADAYERLSLFGMDLS